MSKTKWMTLLSIFTLSVGSVEAASYTVDPAHTEIQFKVKHLTIATVRGTFVDFEGDFEFDQDSIAASSANATIEAKSVNTNNQKRDDHLRSDDFFNVEKNPKITFFSKEVKNVKGDTFTVVGDITINGVTRTIELDAEFNGAATDPWGNERVAFSAESKIDRKDFGLTWNKVMEAGGLVVGDEVKIHVEVEGIKKQDEAAEEKE
jgi:polyisoprenoid-binding protein YceI